MVIMQETNINLQDIEKKVRTLEHLAHSMDAKWVIPWFNIRVGWDTLIGVIPGIGDTITAFISAYIIHEAHQMGIPFWTKFRMALNIIIDWFIGLFPLIGDILDIGWKANIRNVSLIKRYLEKQAREKNQR